jgi:glycine/D-amino acid oxidase-like deaminating enzyme/nitrite reductase/ring-hydroxylating ferredoxin subunit
VTTSDRESLWLSTSPAAEYQALDGERSVDVAVIGAGITGLTTALLLKRGGARVAVLEARRVGSGVTGCTTAKVSALQQTMYRTLRWHHGDEGASAYAEASLAAVELIATLADDERIDCELERRAAFTYAATSGERSTVEAEFEASSAAGLPVTLVEEGGVDLPYRTYGAVRLDDQLELHPVRYVQGLARAVDGDGCVVLENTRALAVESGSPCHVRTDRGTVQADQVVDAAHYPMLDRGLFFARLEPARSYCIAARVGGSLPTGMSISTSSPTRSVRSYRGLLLVGGEGHATGARKATPERYERLAEFAREHWQRAEVTHRWSAQDPVSWDHFPVIGRYHPGSSRLFVASGFHKWGLTSGTAAGRIISDLIAGVPNPLAEPFDPARIGAKGLPKVGELGAKFVVDMVSDRVTPAPSRSSVELQAGEGRVVRAGLGKKGLYRDRAGAVHAVSLRCTHLGCLLRFNAAEHSWDCPCHGSRFDVDGSVLEGPATHPLDHELLES